MTSHSSARFSRRPDGLSFARSLQVTQRPARGNAIRHAAAVWDSRTLAWRACSGLAFVGGGTAGRAGRQSGSPWSSGGSGPRRGAISVATRRLRFSSRSSSCLSSWRLSSRCERRLGRRTTNPLTSRTSKRSSPVTGIGWTRVQGSKPIRHPCTTWPWRGGSASSVSQRAFRTRARSVLFTVGLSRGIFLHHRESDHRFLLWLRLPNVLLGALTVLLTFFAVRTVTSDRWTPVVAAAIVATTPRFVFLSAFVTNDNLANFLGALLTLLALRFVVSPSAWRMVLVGGAVGLLIITKLSALPLAAVLVVAVFASRRWLDRARVALVGCAAALGVCGWYLVQNAGAIRRSSGPSGVGALPPANRRPRHVRHALQGH